MKKPIKCRHADRYKAKNQPKCGCDVCQFKWEIAELRRDLRNYVSVLSNKIEEAWFF